MQKFDGTHGWSAFWMLLSLQTALAKVDAFCAVLLMHIKRSPRVTNCVCPGWVFGLAPAAGGLAPAAGGVAPAAAVGVTLNGLIL